MLDFFRITPKKRTVKIRAKSGIIYHNPSKPRRAIFAFGNVLLISAIFYLIYLYWPLGRASAVYIINKNQWFGTKEITYAIPEPSADKTDFSIQIPRILASSKIVADVSPFDKEEYLKVLATNQVAQAKGSSYPGSGKGTTTYIFAHSTQQGYGVVRNNSVFYLLGELQKDDPIYIKYSGKVYIYKVYNQIVVNPSEVEYLSYRETDKEMLILQTCWPIGTDWKRLLVFAKLIN